jgi:Fic family protein
MESRIWASDATVYAPPKYRRACSYDVFLPDPLAGFDLRLGVDVAGAVSEAEHVVQRLNASAYPALAPLARLLLRTESVASSKIEGLQLGSRELARAEARLEVGAKAGNQAREILANIDAMELSIDEASTGPALSVDRIRAIHVQLLQGGPHARIAGVIRTEQNWIGGNDYDPCGAAFVPPPPEALPGLLDDLCTFASTAHLPPLVQAAVLHAQFETLHPFMDGNGRTGRALIHVVLRRRGLAPAYVPPISVMLAANKARYINGLTAFREGDVESWIVDFAASTANAAALAEGYLLAVRMLQEQWRDAVRSRLDLRSDAAAWRVIDVLPAHPVISSVVATAAIGRSKAVVMQALHQLESAGVLERLSGGERNRTWEASGLLDLLAGMENAEPADP